MNVFVYEHITSGALVDDILPSSLMREGAMMRDAIINDCLQTKQCQISVMQDHRLKKTLNSTESSSIQSFTVDDSTQYRHYWQHCLNACDAIIIIAPESDQCLATLHQQALKYNKRCLGSSLEAIRITSDKQQCHLVLQQQQLSVPNSVLANHWTQHAFNSPNGYISKPIDGAGCLNTFFWPDRKALEAALPQHQTSVIQTFIPGHTLSLSLLYSQQDSCVLSINQQHIRCQDKQFELSACSINDVDPSHFSTQQAYALAQQIHNAIPGLWGFVGIDLIINDDACYIIDINPRPTTSYCGLHHSLNINPMQLLFNILADKPLPQNIMHNATPAHITL